MSDFITLGIGPGGDIYTFILVGLWSPAASGVQRIVLTLYARASDLTMEERSGQLTPLSRSFELTAEDR